MVTQSMSRISLQHPFVYASSRYVLHVRNVMKRVILSIFIKRIGYVYAGGDDSQALSKVGCSDNGRGCTDGYRSLFLVTDGPWGQYCNKIRAPFGPFIVLVCQ